MSSGSSRNRLSHLETLLASLYEILGTSVKIPFLYLNGDKTQQCYLRPASTGQEHERPLELSTSTQTLGVNRATHTSLKALIDI